MRGGGGGGGGKEPPLHKQAPNASIDYYCGPKGHSQQFCHALLDYLVWAYETTDAPLVHSFSYGVPGRQCKDEIRVAIDTELQKLATRRVTTLWASGCAAPTHLATPSR